MITTRKNKVQAAPPQEQTTPTAACTIRQPIFRSAITEADGQTINVGYLSLFALMTLIVGAIPFMCIMAAWSMYFDSAHTFKVQDLGIGVGAVCTGFAAALGALGVFIIGDRRNSNEPPNKGSV